MTVDSFKFLPRLIATFYQMNERQPAYPIPWTPLSRPVSACSFALVTSANLDRRSFELNFEVSTLVYDSDFASNLRFLQRSYMADSRLVSAADWPRRPWGQRLLENAAGVLSPLL